MLSSVVEVDQHPTVPQDDHRGTAPPPQKPSGLLPGLSRAPGTPRRISCPAHGHPTPVPPAHDVAMKGAIHVEHAEQSVPEPFRRSGHGAPYPEAHGPGAHGRSPLPEAYGVPRLVLMVKISRPSSLTGNPGKPAGRGTLAHRTRDRLPGNGPGRAHRQLPGGRRRPLPLSGPGGRALLPGLPPRKRSGTAPGKQRRVHAAGASLGAGERGLALQGELSRWFHWQPGGPWSPGFDLAAVERWPSVQRTSSDGRFEVEVWTR